MTLLYIFVLVLINGCWASPQPTVSWFEQNIDHFNFKSPGTFKEKILTTDQFWKGDGPIFFYTGNEGDIEGFWNASGFVFTLAQEHNAYVAFAEHRYYGESLPFGKDSWTGDNIGHLAIEQALADYAVFLTDLQEKLGGKKKPVVAFGGSYGGSLTAYFRMHYPQVVWAGLAASAPILLYDPLTKPNAYFEVVTQDFKDVHSDCPTLINDAQSYLLELGAKQKYTQIQEEMSLCKAPASMEEVTNLVFWARNAYVFIAMLDYPYQTHFFGSLPAWPVNASCQAIHDYRQHGQTLLQAFAASVGIYYNGTGTLDCYSIAEEFYQCADPTGCGGSRTNHNAMSWDYQACTECVHDIGANNKTDMFYAAPFSLAELTDYCQKTWGVTPRPKWNLLNTPLEASSRIFFSNGMLDPWHVGGVLQQAGPELPFVFIPESAHHLDLRAPNPADPESVRKARDMERKWIAKWLADYEREHRHQ